MKTFSTLGEAREAILNFCSDHLGDKPEMFKSAFKKQAASLNAADAIVGVMEIMYASRDIIGNEGMDLVASLASYATSYDYHELGRSGRGQMIVQAMSRDMGDQPTSGVTFQPREDDAPSNALYDPQPTQVFVMVPAAEVPAAEEPSTDVQP